MIARDAEVEDLRGEIEDLRETTDSLMAAVSRLTARDAVIMHTLEEMCQAAGMAPPRGAPSPPRRPNRPRRPNWPPLTVLPGGRQ